MKRIFLALLPLTLSADNQPTHPLQATIDRAIESTVYLALGTACGTLACYSVGETLVDGGHRYHELKLVYKNYLEEMVLLDPYDQVTTPAEKRMWAANQMISRIPKVFWREIASGSFSVFMGIVAKDCLGKAYAS